MNYTRVTKRGDNGYNGRAVIQLDKGHYAAIMEKGADRKNKTS